MRQNAATIPAAIHNSAQSTHSPTAPNVDLLLSVTRRTVPQLESFPIYGAQSADSGGGSQGKYSTKLDAIQFMVA